MTTKKIVLIVGVVIATGVLVVVAVAGSIVGFAFYSIGKSQAATTAKNFLRNNQKLKQDIGEVKDFGTFVTGGINVANDSGEATLNLKVVGERATVNASVDLVYRNGRDWRVSSASYTNQSGQKINLLNPYESKRLLPLLIA
ncbi:MAG TPA: cytochrome c oxidase assembly factor Coa1 family protein [Pyrinomonadaceae bacterium]|nr:cytochrome c oxidase assembly factor Coa1 family protein [Pyrinomonadaceae bacterium]